MGNPEQAFAADITSTVAVVDDNNNGAVNLASYPYNIYEPPANSQVGKVHVVTGGTTGLGLESAKRIAAAGGTVILTSRTSTKGEKAIQQVRTYLNSKSIKNSEVYYLTLDLDDIEGSVKTFPKRYEQLMLSSSGSYKKM